MDGVFGCCDVYDDAAPGFFDVDVLVRTGDFDECAVGRIAEGLNGGVDGGKPGREFFGGVAEISCRDQTDEDGDDQCRSDHVDVVMLASCVFVYVDVDEAFATEDAAGGYGGGSGAESKFGY